MKRSPSTRFIFRLALRLGWINPYLMLRQIPAWLLTEWEAYHAMEPFDEVRADYRSAQVAQMLFNVNRSEKTDARPIKDFVLDFQEDLESPAEKARKQSQQSLNKMRVAELFMRAQSEVAGEMQAKQPPRVIEEHYPQPQPAEDKLTEVLAKARAASIQVDQ